MFNRFERLHHHRPESRPPITDPYRQVHELELHATYQGPHSFLGYENPQPARREWKVVPITTPNHYFQGLQRLIDDVKEKNIESSILEPSPFDPLVGIRFYFKDRKTYQRDLKQMFEKYSGIHKSILKKFTQEEKERLAKILAEAKTYEPTDAVKEDPNWSPRINHVTGKPYGFWPYDTDK